MARPKQAKLATRLSHQYARAGSSELGNGDFNVDFNPRTGRPVRRMRKSGSPFMDSAVALSDEEASNYSDDSLPKNRKRKRGRRSPSPALPEVYGYPSDAIEQASSSPQSRDGGSRQININNVTINLPAGHVGPIILHVDPFSTSTGMSSQANHAAAPETATPSKSQKKPIVKAKKRAGFLDLPAELRNTIYDHVFVVDGRFNFGRPKNFSRSAAFLRTCRQVYNEGRTILYSDNEFYFKRRLDQHGSYWEDDWRELGFKHLHHLLKMIGPVNISLIRRLSFQFDDATPSLNPSDMTHEERRFVNDGHLMAVLRLLGDSAKLETLAICFRGRRRVERSDNHMLELLRRIKTDQLAFSTRPSEVDFDWELGSSVEESVRKTLTKAMLRKRKLYDVK